MALSTYALVSEAELKGILSIDVTQVGQDSVIQGVINRASEAIETFLGRQIVTRGSITEYHTTDGYLDVLISNQFPVTTVTSIKEGEWSGGVWTAATTLTASTDYVYEAASGRFFRLNSKWKAGRDGVQLVYAAGYANTAAVPGPIKEICLNLAARRYSQIKRGGDFAAQTVSDAVGSVTRFLPSELLTMERQALYAWRSHNYSQTGRV